MENFTTESPGNFTTLSPGNFTTPSPGDFTTLSPDSSTVLPDSIDSVKGYIALTITVVMFGLNYVPVKKINAGDGLFFQFIMANGIFLVGVAVGAVRGFPENYPMAMLSGASWATGTLCVVPIVKTIGLGLGVVLWSSSSLLNGWATGRFGWFGLKPAIPTNITLNYLGVVCALISTSLFVFVKPHHKGQKNLTEQSHLIQVEEEMVDSVDELTESSRTVYDQMPPLGKRILGIFLALFSGCLYGQQLTSVIYIETHPEIYPGASTNGLDYVFMNFLGIYLATAVYFLIYCIVRGRDIYVKREIVLPGMASGIMLAIGQAGFFVTTESLSQAVSFPICTSLPALISSLFSIVFFREIRGRKNFILLAVAGTVAVTGSVLTGLSKLD